MINNKNSTIIVIRAHYYKTKNGLNFELYPTIFSPKNSYYKKIINIYRELVLKPIADRKKKELIKEGYTYSYPIVYFKINLSSDQIIIPTHFQIKIKSILDHYNQKIKAGTIIKKDLIISSIKKIFNEEQILKICRL